MIFIAPFVSAQNATLVFITEALFTV